MKLVRDRIPELFGGVPRALTEAEFEQALREKLREETQEYLESGDLSELADILEVVYALAALEGVTGTELDMLREEKRQRRGAFELRLAWEEEQEANGR